MANEFRRRILAPAHRKEAVLREYCDQRGYALTTIDFPVNSRSRPGHPGLKYFLVPNQHGWMVWSYDKNQKWKVRPDGHPTDIFGNPEDPQPNPNGLARDHGLGILVGVYANDGVLDAYPTRWGAHYYAYEEHPDDDGFWFFYNSENSPIAPQKQVWLFANDAYHNGLAHAYNENEGTIDVTIAVFPYTPTETPTDWEIPRPGLSSRPRVTQVKPPKE